MWKDLTMREKSEVMAMAVKSGLTDLNQIANLYDSISEPNIYKKGGQKENANSPKVFSSPEEMIKAHEGFRSTPYKDGRNKKTGQQWYSVGYGFNDSGLHPNIGRQYIGKQMSRDEADKLLVEYVDHLKSSLRKQLGDNLYNGLTPGQLMAYLDVGYQLPSAMYNAAKIHRNSGDLNAVANALAVRGYDERNANRRYAFLGNISTPQPQVEQPVVVQQQPVQVSNSIMVEPPPMVEPNPGIVPMAEPQPVEEKEKQLAPYLVDISSESLPQQHRMLRPEMPTVTPNIIPDSYILFHK